MTFENDPPSRRPRVLKLDEIEPAPQIDEWSETSGAASQRRMPVPERRLTVSDINRGFRFGGILFGAMASLASLAAGLWFARFVSVALERQDWVGWTAFGLLMVIAFALTAIVLRELIGFRRLARLAKLRALVKATLAKPDAVAERTAADALIKHYRARPDLAWGLARVNDHRGDVLAPGELLRLTDRELIRPLDVEARRIILKSAKRVATVSALSPILWIAMGFVLVENVRMFRSIATIYGGRPGVLGALRLAKLVVGHVIATGGIGMTDDLLGQFVGQDVLRRLSRRLGEGAFNGALTARLGVVAAEVTRPLPYLDTEPLRVREIFNELFRSLRSSKATDDRPSGRAG
ncbi:TIGR01620 family protein [Hyphomicrobium methylovorum]|uniref:YcjF family protein n=1 Tax=Hyphomicrobium methylovorum TaxID=84 RepID=UPI0015E6A7DE|nr:TIGR01620 family protein [Hyphomicrobium methylovorum]MBA2127820.1 TIGR01620 family protein [Hyphomicrobium methylovorum]